MTAAVPVISMSLPADRFAADFGGSFERFGFAMITDHGIDPALIDDAWAKAKAFFALPEEVKRAYHIPGGGGARGYTPFGTEIAKGAKEVDLKEFWHVGRDLPPGHPVGDAQAVQSGGKTQQREVFQQHENEPARGRRAVYGDCWRSRLHIRSDFPFPHPDPFGCCARFCRLTKVRPAPLRQERQIIYGIPILAFV